MKPENGRPREVALASRSPRRLEILMQQGFAVEIVPSPFDESSVPRDLDPVRYAAEAARGKAFAASSPKPVVAADTIVVVDGAILGKPWDAPDAGRMLALLAGRTHDVLTAVALRHQGELLETVEWSTVTFAPMTAAQIAAYVETGEPFDKAGAYAIQGAAARHILRFTGSYWNIVGFPIEKFLEMWNRLFPS